MFQKGKRILPLRRVRIPREETDMAPFAESLSRPQPREKISGVKQSQS